MPIHRPDMEEPQFTEQGMSGHHLFGQITSAPGRCFQFCWEMAGDILHNPADRMKRLRGNQLREIGRHRPHRRGNGHIIIIQNHNQITVRRTGIIHRLISHASRHRPITNHGNHVIIPALQIARHRHAITSRNRSRGMARAKGVKFRFAAFGKARQTAFLPQAAHAFTPAGQNLMRIGLMPDIPNQLIFRGVKHIMQGHSQLNHTKTGA